MSRYRIKAFSAICAALLACVIALGSVAPAAAQTATPTPPVSSVPNERRQQGAFVLIVAKGLIDATVSETGITERDLLKELYAGKSLNEIITAKNGKAENVKTAATKQITETLNQLVKDGKTTQTQVDLALKNLSSMLDRAMDGEFNGVFRERIQDTGRTAIERILRQLGGANALFEETAKATGLSQRDLLTQIRAGKTLAQIAKDKNVDPKTIIDAAVKQTSQRLNLAVKAGRIKQEDADKAITALPAEYEKIMNSANPLNPAAIGRNPGARPSATPDAPATPSL